MPNEVLTFNMYQLLIFILKQCCCNITEILMIWRKTLFNQSKTCTRFDVISLSVEWKWRNLTRLDLSPATHRGYCDVNFFSSNVRQKPAEIKKTSPSFLKFIPWYTCIWVTVITLMAQQRRRFTHHNFPFSYTKT